jgi:hypothetical protein
MDEKRERILRFLRAGHIIRLIDGRVGDSFVDTDTLREMIADGSAEQTNLPGMAFVQLPTMEKGKTT